MKVIILYIIAVSMLFIQLEDVSQISDKHLENIPEYFADEFLITNEKTVGKRLSYKAFKRGNFTDASQKEINNFMNTMLLGTATKLFNYLDEKYTDFEPIVVKPNGFTSTSFYIKYKYSKGEIFIIRSMKTSEFRKDAMAAENPENYNLLFAFNFKEAADQEEIVNVLNSYIEENGIESEMQNR